MKNNTVRMKTLAALAFVCFVSAACENVDGPHNTPLFPETVTDYEVEPGSKIELTFTPNMDWTLEVDNPQWFKILDGGFELQSINGKKSSSVTVTIVTAAAENLFDLVSCNVSLTMGGKTEVIAKYMLKTGTKMLKVYAATGVDSFEYETEEMTSIGLLWSEPDERFDFPIRIESNFNYTIEWPEWARADFGQETVIGTSDIEVYGVASKLPLNSSAGKIVFKYGEETVKEYDITFAGCSGFCYWDMSHYTELIYDHAGYYTGSNDSYSSDTVQGYIYGADGSDVVVAELENGKYVVKTDSWCKVTAEAYDNGAGADVLQKRSVSLEIPRWNGTESRSAALFFLSAAEAADMTAESEMDPSRYSNVFYITQTARPSEYFTIKDCDNVKLTEKSVTVSDIADAYTTDTYQCELDYTEGNAIDKNGAIDVYLRDPYSKITVYDENGYLVETGSWLGYTDYLDNLYGSVSMTDTSKEKEQTFNGYLAFWDENNRLLAVAHCIYNALEKKYEDVFTDVSETYFTDPAAARFAGLSLVRLTEGPTFDELYRDFPKAVILYLTFKNENQVAEIKLGQSSKYYQMPYTLCSYITVNGEDFSESSGVSLTESDKATIAMAQIPDDVNIEIYKPSVKFHTSMGVSDPFLVVFLKIDSGETSND